MRIVIDTNVLISGVFFGGFPRQKAMEIIEPVTHVEICRDPDDNKYLECAKDSHALYIVSGDKDLLVMEQFVNIQIVTAKDFCEKYFSE